MMSVKCNIADGGADQEGAGSGHDLPGDAATRRLHTAPGPTGDGENPSNPRAPVGVRTRGRGG